MKTFKQSILFLFIMSFSLGAFSQIVVVEETTKFAKEMVNTLTVEIKETDAKEVMKEFKTLMKDYKGEVRKEKKQNLSRNTSIPEISNDPIVIYFTVDKKAGGGSILKAAFKLPGGFISSSATPEQFASASKLLQDFSIKSSKGSISGNLKAAIKAKGKLTKAQAKITKENAKLNKSIAKEKRKITKAQNEIKKAEDSLSENNKKLAVKEEEIALQQKRLNEIQSSLKNIK